MRIPGRWRGLGERVVGVGIGVKIMGIALGAVALFGAVGVVQMERGLSRTWRRHLQATGIWVARTAAEGGLEMVLTGDTVGLHDFLAQIEADNPDVHYLLVLDGKGRAIAHTFPHPVSPDLLNANSAAGSASWRLQGLDTEEGILWDVAVPILGGAAGVIRVGLSERALRQSLTANLRSLLWVLAAVAATTVLGALGLTGLLTRRIHRLVQVTRAAGHGDFSARAPATWSDEIGQMTASVNRMMEGLERAQAELRRKEQARLSLLSQLMRAQEEERRRVARELHDQTGQTITSLLVGLRLAAEADTLEEARERLAEVRALATGTLDEIRNLAWELRPAVLDDHGLTVALDRYAKHCRERYGFQVDWHGVRLGGERLPAEVETALYRIIQEALTNVARHAGARQVSIVLERRPEEVTAIIEDDGCGFDAEAVAARPERTLGLYGMEERATLLGGSFEVEARPGKGTTIFVHLPLRKAEEAASWEPGSES